MPSVVYFVQAASGPIKIGIAGNVERRLGALQSATHETLTLLCTVPGDASLEAALHERFKAGRIRGEWFRPDTPGLALLIKQVFRDELPAWLTGADEPHVPDFCACGWPIEGEQLTDRGDRACWTCLAQSVPVVSEVEAISPVKLLDSEPQRRLPESNRCEAPVGIAALGAFNDAALVTAWSVS